MFLSAQRRHILSLTASQVVLVTSQRVAPRINLSVGFAGGGWTGDARDRVTSRHQKFFGSGQMPTSGSFRRADDRLHEMNLCFMCLSHVSETLKVFLAETGLIPKLPGGVRLSDMHVSENLYEQKLIIHSVLAGCDSGFGNVTAKHLDSLGFNVFATVLDLKGDGARELQRTCSPRLTLLQVDITQPQQVQQALLDTKAKLGLKGKQQATSFAETNVQLWRCW